MSPRATPAKRARKVTKKTPAATSKRVAKKTPKAAPRPSKPMTAAEIHEAFRRWQALDPEPKTELEYSTPFELLVAVALLAQAADSGVNKATRRLFPVANTPAAIAALGVGGLKPYIVTIGLFNTKAANVVRLAELLLERHGGEVPEDRDSLEALPGVGRKTANVVLNAAFGHSTMAVDTHIFRVGNRTGLAAGKDARVVEDRLVKRVPAEYLRHAHHWLILHGRYVCKARKPDCGLCPIHDLCHWPEKLPASGLERNGSARPAVSVPTGRRSRRPPG